MLLEYICNSTICGAAFSLCRFTEAQVNIYDMAIVNIHPCYFHGVSTASFKKPYNHVTMFNVNW